MKVDFVEYLARQVAVSRCNFGPNERSTGVIDHIRKELIEVEAEDTAEGRAKEWVDVVILALDGLTRAVRQNFRDGTDIIIPCEPSADDIAHKAVSMVLIKQQGKNELRNWPDWRTVPEDKAIEHKRGTHD